MKNVTMRRDGAKLILEIDLSLEMGPSKSGKTIIVASTDGNIKVPESDVVVGLNAYRYATVKA